jgi:hypothetical protein
MLALITFAAYLTVGTIVARFYLASQTELIFSINSSDIFFSKPIQDSTEIQIANPEMRFAEVKLEKIQIKPRAKIAKTIVPRFEKKIEVEKPLEINPVSLPFKELIQLSKIEVKKQIPVNLATNYKPFRFESQTQIAESVKPDQKIQTDEVSNVMAAADNSEMEFFDYPAAKENGPIEPVLKTSKNKETDKIPTDEGRIESFDYSKLRQEAKTTDSATVKSEEISINNLVSFNATQANQDAVRSDVKFAAVITQAPKKQTLPPQQEKSLNKEQDAFLSSQEKFQVEMTIQASGIDFLKIHPIHGFELRFQDSLQGIEDYGSGEVSLKATLAQPKMTRSVVILKSGFTPTNTDLILESGNTKTSIPLIDEIKFNELNQQVGVEDNSGAVVVELDDETELAQLDIPFKSVIKLSGDFVPTSNSDYRYLAFLGAKSGNALLTYVRADGLKVNKIVHIHENEVTFDSNYYETVINEKFQLFEEDLLGKQKSPLIVSSDSVKIFAKEESAKKINDNTYKLNFDVQQLAGRKYIELSHQDEPVFVGFRENNQIDVPSENFMRHVLSKFENAKLGDRCLIQVNLNKKTRNFEVGAESVNSSLVTYSQVLETDGKFYDSLSDKSEKIIIIGENQSSEAYSQDAKVNIRIEFSDGSEQYLSSYCSPNTYLVEQL